MAELFWLSDEQWLVIEPFMPKNQPGPERQDDRRIISGILHVLTAGCRWSDCPAAYGPPTTVYIRLRPEHRDHVWAYDFVEDRTHDGRKIRMLNIVDEFSRECLAIKVARRLKAIDVIDALSDLFMPHAACQDTSDPTTGRSSSPRPCRSGSLRWAQGRPTSPQAARGRTAMSSRSTPGSGMNC